MSAPSSSQPVAVAKWVHDSPALISALSAAMVRVKHLKRLRRLAAAWCLDLQAPELGGVCLRLEWANQQRFDFPNNATMRDIEALLDLAVAQATTAEEQ